VAISPSELNACSLFTAVVHNRCWDHAKGHPSGPYVSILSMLPPGNYMKAFAMLHIAIGSGHNDKYFSGGMTRLLRISNRKRSALSKPDH